MHHKFTFAALVAVSIAGCDTATNPEGEQPFPNMSVSAQAIGVGPDGEPAEVCNLHVMLPWAAVPERWVGTVRVEMNRAVRSGPGWGPFVRFESDKVVLAATRIDGRVTLAFGMPVQDTLVETASSRAAVDAGAWVCADQVPGRGVEAPPIAGAWRFDPVPG